MGKERLFELIRKEEVVLFVGAGMSIYAGYPNGEKLSKFFYENLPDHIKNDLTLTKNLPQLTDDIYNLYNGNNDYLIETLKKVFDKKPTSADTHELLAKIPHFKTIITTNYDTLIESTNYNIEVIRNSKDYANADLKKQLLFKIHGDLTYPEGIILTNTDYNRYFSKSQEHTVFWNAVKDKLASSHVLFIGYSMDDSNINVIIDKLINELGENRKEMFFVTPYVSAPKKAFLQRNNITVYRATGEELIKESYEDLKLNYFPDLSKGIGTADVALNFANLNNFNLDLSKKDNLITISSYRSIDGKEKSEFKLDMLFPKENAQQFSEALKGKSFDNISLKGEVVKELSHYLNGFRLKKETRFKSLTLIRAPFFSDNVEIVFEDGFELENYKVELYIAQPDENEKHLKFVLQGFTVIVKLEFNSSNNSFKFNIKIIPDKTIKTTLAGLKFYEMLSKIVSNQNFKVFRKNELLYNFNIKPNFKKDALDAHFLYNYFKKLKKIETHFGVRFTDINLEECNETYIRNILAYIDKIQVYQIFNSLDVIIDDQKEIERLNKSELTKEDKNDKALVISNKEILKLELHNLEFSIGYPHQIIYDVYIANKEELKNKKNKEVKLKSKTNKIYFQFSDKDIIYKKGKKPVYKFNNI